MIKGVHAMFYSSDAEAMRAYLRDRVGLPFRDVGGGWLIFDVPEAEVGCHPTEKDGAGTPSATHQISFYTDDLDATVAELRSRGVEFDDEVTDAGYGLTIHFTMPGGVRVELYQPHY